MNNNPFIFSLDNKRYHTLNYYNKTVFGKKNHVFGKVEIFRSERTADVIIFVTADFIFPFLNFPKYAVFQ